MKIYSSIAAMCCAAFALHYTEVLPASQIEALVPYEMMSQAASSARALVETAIKSATVQTAAAPKACPPTECRIEVVRTVSEAPSPQAVVVSVPAAAAVQPKVAAAPVVQLTVPVASPFQPSIVSLSETPAPALAPALAAKDIPAGPTEVPAAKSTKKSAASAAPAATRHSSVARAKGAKKQPDVATSRARQDWVAGVMSQANS